MVKKRKDNSNNNSHFPFLSKGGKSVPVPGRIQRFSPFPAWPLSPPVPLTKSLYGVKPAAILPALPIVPTAVFVEEGTILFGPPGNV